MGIFFAAGWSPCIGATLGAILTMGLSQQTAEELVSLGYTNIWNLKNGMVEWEQVGYEVERQP